MTSQRRENLQYIADMQPDIVDTSAAEFTRVAKAAADRKTEGERYRNTIEWDGAGRDTYESDLANTLTDLATTGTCCGHVGAAITDYAGRIRTAQQHLSDGETAEKSLYEDCVAAYAEYGVHDVDVEDPIQTWQQSRADVRDATLRQLGDSDYQATTGAYDQSEQTANQARDTATTAIDKARLALPTITSADPPHDEYTVIQHAAGHQTAYETEMNRLHHDWAQAFQQMFGRAPESDGDWQLAQNAATRSGFPVYDKVGKHAITSGFRFKPTPGQHGVVKVDIFIGARQAGVAGDDDRGDDRGFDAFASPDDNRVTMYLDMDTGLAVVRQNPTLDADQTQGFEQDNPLADNYQVAQAPDGTLAIHYGFQNPHHHPGWSPVDANPAIDGTVLVAPKPDGSVQVSGDADGFPSYEITQTKDGAVTDLAQEQEHQVTDLSGLPGQARYDFGPDSGRAADLNSGYDWDNPANRPDPGSYAGGMPDRYPAPVTT